MNYEVVYTAFLSRMTDDEWETWEEDALKQDLRELLKAAISWFKFPSSSMDGDEVGFFEELKPQEIQILASYMKVEWLNRTIHHYENVRPLYEERDFSQANLLSKFTVLLSVERKNARILESLFYRAEDHKPYDYSVLAGGGK